MNILAKKLKASNTVSFLLGMLVVLSTSLSVWAEDEIVDLGGTEVSKAGSDFKSAYNQKTIESGIVNLSGAADNENLKDGVFTIGKDALLNSTGEFRPNHNCDFSIINGGSFSTSSVLCMPFRYGNQVMVLNNGHFVSSATGTYTGAYSVNFGYAWNNKTVWADNSMKLVIDNQSTFRVTEGTFSLGRSKSEEKKINLQVDFAVTNSEVVVSKGQIVLSNNKSKWITDNNKSYLKAVFGPGAQITTGQIYVDGNYPKPSVIFDGASIHWTGNNNSFIGHNSSIGDVYRIDKLGLTIDIPEGKSLTCDANASSLKGEGGITKIGEGSITWNNVSSGGSAGMTFTGPLVVSNGTWSSSLSYAATAFAVDGATSTLALSGELTAAAPDFSVTAGGTLDLVSKEPKDRTAGTLMLGENAVLKLNGGAMGVDSFSATSLDLAATAANPVKIEFTDAANISGGAYTLVAITGGGAFAAGDETKFALDANVPQGSTLSVSGASLVLNVPLSNPATWTGGANDGKFSSVGNWFGNKVPGANDEVVINVDSETSLTCDVALNVKSITFHSLSAKVSIKGTGSIVIAESIANDSDARHVIGVPVEFKSADEYAPIDVTGEVDFQGGVTGTVPVNHATFYGKYTLTATSWTLNTNIKLAAGSIVSAENMTLYPKGKKISSEQSSSFSLKQIYVNEMNGRVFDAFYGALIVPTYYVYNPNGTVYLASGFYGVMRVGYVHNHTAGTKRDVVFAPEDGATIIMGGSGFESKTGWLKLGSFVVRSSGNWNLTRINSNYSYSSVPQSLEINSGSFDVDTSDYDDSSLAGHTVSIVDNGTKFPDASVHLKGAGAMSAFGNGCIKFNSTAYFTGGFTASNGVTVAVNKNVYPGKGNVTIKDTATLSLVQSSSGTVPVAGTLTMKGGTTLRIPEFVAGVLPLSVGALAFDGVTEESKVALNIESGALVEGYNAIIKTATTLPENAWDNFNVTLNATVPAGMTPLFIAQGDTLYIVVKGANDAIWTGAGADAKFSTGSNWMGGQIPANGSCVHIAAAGETTLVNDINGFSPSSITFPAGSSAITIDGEAITGVVAITNLSTTTSHTINVPVYFAGDILVKQAAMAAKDDITKAHVTFAGGAHAAQGCSIENGNAAAIYSRCMFGKYYLYPTEEEPWTASYQGSSRRNCLGADSALYLPYAGSLHEVYIGSGSMLTVGDVHLKDDNRLCLENLGEYVITNELEVSGSGKKDGYAAYYGGASASDIFKIEKATCVKTDGWTFYFAQSYEASQGTYYFGKGGINFGTGNGYFGIGRDKDGDEQTIRPWYGDFTIALGTGNTSKGYDIYMLRNVVFNTDDENGVGRTITLDARLRFDKTPTFKVSGSGKVLVNSATTKSATEPPVTVADTATLAFKPGAMLTKDSITVNEGATLEVAQSGVVSIEGTLSPVSGATLAFNFTDRKLAPVLEVAALDNENTDPNGIIWISIRGLRPVGGQHVLTSGGVFGERQIKLVEESRPDWVKSVSCANGEIVVDIKPIGSRIVVR